MLHWIPASCLVGLEEEMIPLLDGRRRYMEEVPLEGGIEGCVGVKRERKL